MPAPYNDMAAFHAALRSSKRILALCGAGLSASSGLPTFRGQGGLWRNHDATKLATPGAFRADPGFVWLFYGYRRHICLRASPNDAHYALAALGRENPDFLCLTQNVDSHPKERLYTLHGSLFDIKCSNDDCDWIQHGNFDDPFCPALAEASVDMPNGGQNPLLDPDHRVKTIPLEELPKCPKCQTGLQRPGVVWFGEDLDESMLDQADSFISRDKLDMILVVGTSAQVWPAAGYIAKARAAGARVCTVDPMAETADAVQRLRKGDFAFACDAATTLPVMLEPVIGKLQKDGTLLKNDAANEESVA